MIPAGNNVKIIHVTGEDTKWGAGGGGDMDVCLVGGGGGLRI